MNKVITRKVIDIIAGTAIPKTESDQNTDDIMPARYLKEISFARMGEFVYFDERFANQDPGQPVAEHPFNSPKYAGGVILVAGANYGCGSSREHAPQGLMRYGIEAVVAPSFAEIFAGNCASIGIAAVAVPQDEVDKLARAVMENPQMPVEVNLVENLVKYNGNSATLQMHEGRRQAFISGRWDNLQNLLENEEGIKAIEARLPYL